MIISTTYKDGESVQLEANFNADYYPENYTVKHYPVNEPAKIIRYPGTKNGARMARKLYENISSIIEHRRRENA